MKYYKVHDNQGCSFMDYSHDEPLTAQQIRAIRWQDYSDNLTDDEDTIKWSKFTLDFICDVWDIELEQVKYVKSVN